jgi:hypothetical protein
MKNGIWLCQNCAKLIDNDERRYTVAALRQWKAVAELEAHHRIGKTQTHFLQGTDWNLHDRRRKVRDDTKEFINFALARLGDINLFGPEYSNFRKTMETADTLFPTDVRSYLEDVDKTVKDLWTYAQNRKKVVEVEEIGDDDAIRKDHELQRHLNDLLQMIRGAFLSYLSVSAPPSALQQPALASAQPSPPIAGTDIAALRAKFVRIVEGLRLRGGNCHNPKFGSPEYLEAEEMADRGWFHRTPHGYIVQSAFNPSAF